MSAQPARRRSTQTMATQGGMDFIHQHGRRWLRCPAFGHGCQYQVELTDMGELVDTGVTELQLRSHLAAHDVTDWLRVIRAEVAERQRWEETCRHAGLCSWCECPRGQCVALWPNARKCCPDCEHSAVEPQAEVVAKCCAEHAMTELARTVQELDGDAHPDETWTRAKVREHLALVQREHAEKGADGGHDG